MGKDIATSNYNGLVLTTRYQGRRGIYLQGSYTFGKSLDDSSSWAAPSGQPGNVADPRHLKLDWGPSNFDLRHRAVFTYVIDVPAGPGHRVLGWDNPVSKQVFGGWQVSGITTVQSGAPFTVYNSSTDFSGFNQTSDRPDVIGTGKLQQDNRSRGRGVRYQLLLEDSADGPGRYGRPRSVLRPRAWSTSISPRPRTSRCTRSGSGCNSGRTCSTSSITRTSPTRRAIRATPISARSRRRSEVPWPPPSARPPVW